LSQYRRNGECLWDGAEALTKIQPLQPQGRRSSAAQLAF
jgi:hypothetical protein